MSALREVAAVFLKLGVIGFGGPAAHIAMMHAEVVTRRQWVSEAEFMDLLAATNMIPGPNSTEMTIHLGYRRAGWPGLIVGGVAFILPAMLIVTALAWAYVRFGSLPAVDWLLWGIKPVVLAIVAHAVYTLAAKALRGKLLWAVMLAAAGLYFAGINELVLLFASGLVVMAARRLLPRLRSAGPAGWLLPLAGAPLPLLAVEPFNLGRMILIFLKIGSVLYGSGYVLLAFLRGDFVTRLGWLTDQQLLDAIAIGQLTPGPLFTTATFIGYLLAGLPGALLATGAIFLPGFVFVAASSRLVTRMRASPAFSAVLDGVVAASLGLMAAVTVQIGRDALPDWWAAALALAALAALIRFKTGPGRLVLVGLAAGLIRAVAGGG